MGVVYHESGYLSLKTLRLTFQGATDPDQKAMLMKMSLQVTAAIEDLERAVKNNDKEKIEHARQVCMC